MQYDLKIGECSLCQGQVIQGVVTEKERPARNLVFDLPKPGYIQTASGSLVEFPVYINHYGTCPKRQLARQGTGVQAPVELSEDDEKGQDHADAEGLPDNTYVEVHGTDIEEPVPIVLHSGGGEPGTGGAAVGGEEHAGDDDAQPKGDPRVQAGLQRGDGSEHVTGERHFGLLGFFAFGVLALESLALIVLGLLLLFVLRLRTFGFGLTLGHPWLSRWSVGCEKLTTSWRAAFLPTSIDAAVGAEMS